MEKINRSSEQMTEDSGVCVQWVELQTVSVT